MQTVGSYDAIEVTDPAIKEGWLATLAAVGARGRDAQGRSLRLSFGKSSLVMPVPMTLFASAFDTLVALRAPTEIRGEQAHLGEPLTLASVARRGCQRLPLGTQEIVILRCSSPGLVGLAAEELAPAALGIRSCGTPPASVAVELRVNGAVVRGSAQCRSYPGRVVLQFHRGRAAAVLRRAYLRRRFPNIVSRAQIPAPRLTQLIETSGFLRLRQVMTIPPSWCRLHLPLSLGMDAAFVGDDGQVVGIVSATRTGALSWLVHQLAADISHPQMHDALFALHDFMMTLPRVVGAPRGYVMCYYDLNKRRNDIHYGSFVRWIADADAVATQPLQRFECPTGAHQRLLSLPKEVSIRVCRRIEEEIVVNFVRQCISHLHAESLGIRAGELNRSPWTPEEVASILPRERTTLTLWRREMLAGVALCEFGDPALSLFGLFNMCHLYSLPGCALTTAEKRLLLHHVRTLYRERGVVHPVVTSPPACLADLEEPGTVCAETMAWHVWRWPILPQYENFYRFRYVSRTVARDVTTGRRRGHASGSSVPTP